MTSGKSVGVHASALEMLISVMSNKALYCCVKIKAKIVKRFEILHYTFAFLSLDSITLMVSSICTATFG